MSLVATRRDGPVAILTLDDPGCRNILSAAMCRAFSTAVKAAEADDTVKALVVTGAGTAFCAGADLDDLKAAAAGDTTTIEAVYRAFLDVADCRLPTIAAVNGPAVGAGLNLALACDIRLASELASFDTRFLKIGLHPGGGHGWLLLRAVGWAEATRMLLLGHPMDAQTARMSGLVQLLCTTDALLPTAIDLARGTDALPRKLIVATKTTLGLAERSTHAESVERETAEQMRSLRAPPFQDLIARLQASLGAR